jgi:RND superfamily putative drug exporter
MLAGGSTLSQMGFAVSFGIVVAAFVMAMFLTPSVTAMLGHRAWWPGHDTGGYGAGGHGAGGHGAGGLGSRADRPDSRAVSLAGAEAAMPDVPAEVP